MKPDPKAHESRMAELRRDIDTECGAWDLPGVREWLLAYADSLATALEQERAAREGAEAEWESALCKALDERNVATLKLQAAEGKLRAAERVIQVLRGGDAGWALRDALDAFDAINPDRSTGGAGEGVGDAKETP